MNSKQNIIAKTSMNTKTDKIEKLSKTLLFPSSALFFSFIRADEGNNSVFESFSILSVLVFIEVFAIIFCLLDFGMILKIFFKNYKS